VSAVRPDGSTCGADRPEQFLARAWGTTVLDETRQRRNRGMLRSRSCFRFDAGAPSNILPPRSCEPKASQRIVQPCDKGTLQRYFRAMRYREFDPGAIVAIFPCDPLICRRSVFAAAWSRASRWACQTGLPWCVGREPRNPEIDTSWMKAGNHSCWRGCSGEGLQRKRRLHWRRICQGWCRLGKPRLSLVGPVRPSGRRPPMQSRPAGGVRYEAEHRGLGRSGSADLPSTTGLRRRTFRPRS